ncbi:MAG: TlpA family protein disulfide reductase [Terracidiphilus sp.]
MIGSAKGFPLKVAINSGLWPRAARRALRRTLIAGFVAASLVARAAPAGSAADNLLNQKAPSFMLTGLDGHTLRLADFRGKVVLLNFWATWCAPCRLEMPVFAAWQRQYAQQGFQVIGISMDDDAAAARGLVEGFKLNYPTAMGNERLAAHYGGVLGLPLTFLIDRNGVVRARFQGETDVRVIEKRVNVLLAGPPVH